MAGAFFAGRTEWPGIRTVSVSGEAKKPVFSNLLAKLSMVLPGGGTRSRETTRMLFSLPFRVKQNVAAAGGDLGLDFCWTCGVSALEWRGVFL